MARETVSLCPDQWMFYAFTKEQILFRGLPGGKGRV